ncbi:MAG: cyanophycinase [Bacteriovorax sp.]|nr:cyanophycinase [Bacteriovorax sp.]
MEKKNNQGKLIIIGGREDRKEAKEILSVVAKAVGSGKLCVVTVASEDGDHMWDIYRKIFNDLGVMTLTHLDVIHRTESIDKKAFAAVKDADAIFFTGGDQLKITSEIGGTIIQDRIMEIYQKGGVIAGTSAGASVMGEIMMIAGASDASYRIGSGVVMSPGLGFATKMIIDQHFAERGRIGRLIGTVAHNPKYLGIGIDENTAIILQDRIHFEVIGSGAVYVLDAHEAHGCNVSEADFDSVLSIFNVRLSVLTNGNCYDIALKKAFNNKELLI